MQIGNTRKHQHHYVAVADKHVEQKIINFCL